MTAIDIRPTQELDHLFSMNPYALPIHGELVNDAARILVETEAPFIDKTTHPDIFTNEGEFSVFKLEGSHPLALISRSIEGTVIAQEGWERTPEDTRDNAAQYEDNSTFFLVVDTTDVVNPKPAATLRVANMTGGGSETVQFYKEKFGADAVLPAELQVKEADLRGGVWDVVGVMSHNGYRGPNGASAWAYFALYKASLVDNIGRWVSNINDKEIRNLTRIGVPFEQIKGTEKVAHTRADGSTLMFGFYALDVSDIRPSMTDKIEALKTLRGTGNAVYRHLAEIGLNGALSVTTSAAA